MEEYIVDGFDEPFKVNPNKKDDFLEWAKKNNKTFELKTPEVKTSGNQNDPANSATVGSDLSTETNLSQNNQQQNTELISDDTSSELPENDYLNFKNKINNIVNSFYKGNNSIKDLEGNLVSDEDDGEKDGIINLYGNKFKVDDIKTKSWNYVSYHDGVYKSDQKVAIGNLPMYNQDFFESDPEDAIEQMEHMFGTGDSAIFDFNKSLLGNNVEITHKGSGKKVDLRFGIESFDLKNDENLRRGSSNQLFSFLANTLTEGEYNTTTENQKRLINFVNQDEDLKISRNDIKEIELKYGLDKENNKVDNSIFETKSVDKLPLFPASPYSSTSTNKVNEHKEKLDEAKNILAINGNENPTEEELYTLTRNLLIDEARRSLQKQKIIDKMNSTEVEGESKVKEKSRLQGTGSFINWIVDQVSDTHRGGGGIMNKVKIAYNLKTNQDAKDLVSKNAELESLIDNYARSEQFQRNEMFVSMVNDPTSLFTLDGETITLDNGKVVPKKQYQQHLLDNSYLEYSLGEIKDFVKENEKTIQELEDTPYKNNLIQRNFNDFEKFINNAGPRRIVDMVSKGLASSNLMLSGVVGYENKELQNMMLNMDDARRAHDNEFQANIEFKDAFSKGNFTKFFWQEIGTQIPIFATLAMPAIGIPTVGLSSSMDNWNNIVRKDKQTGEQSSVMKRTWQSAGFGIAEMVFDKYLTLPIMKSSWRAMYGLKEAAMLDGMKQLKRHIIKNAPRQLAYTPFLEASAEGGTITTQNLLTGKPIYENLDHSLFSGGMFGFMFGGSPFIKGVIMNKFTDTAAKKEYRNNLREITALELQLDGTKNVIKPENAKTIREQIDALKKKNLDIMNKVEMSMGNITEKYVGTMMPLLTEQQKIKRQAEDILGDKKMSNAQKNKALDHLQNKYDQLQTKIDIMLDPKVFGNEFIALVNSSKKSDIEETEDLLAEALDVLTAEGKPDASDKQIEKKAKLIWNTNYINKKHKELNKIYNNKNFKHWQTVDEAVDAIEKMINDGLVSEKAGRKAIDGYRSGVANGASISLIGGGRLSTQVVENMAKNDVYYTRTHEQSHDVLEKIFGDNPLAFAGIGNQIIAWARDNNKSLYVFLTETQKQQGNEEVITNFMEFVAGNPKMFNKNNNGQLASIVSRMFGEGIKKATSSNAKFDFMGEKDAVKFITELAKKIQNGTITLEDVNKLKRSRVAGPDAKGKTKFSQNPEIDLLGKNFDAETWGYYRKRTNPKTGKEEKEWVEKGGAKKAMDTMIEKGLLDGLISAKYKVRPIPVDFKAQVYAEITQHVRNFNLNKWNKDTKQNTENNSLYGWINSQLANKAANVFKEVYAQSDVQKKSKSRDQLKEDGQQMQEDGQTDTQTTKFEEQEIKLRDDTVKEDDVKSRENKSKFRVELGIKNIGKGKVFKAVETAINSAKPITQAKKFITTFEKSLSDILFPMMEKIFPDSNSMVKFRMAIIESIPIKKLIKMQKELPAKDNNGNNFGNIFVKNHGRQSSQDVLTDFMDGTNLSGKNPRNKKLLPDLKKLWDNGAKGLDKKDAVKNPQGAEYYRKKGNGITIYERLPISENTFKSYINGNFTGKKQIAAKSGTKGNNRTKILNESAIAIGKDATPESLTPEFVQDYIDRKGVDMQAADVISKITETIDRPVDLKFSENLKDITFVQSQFESNYKDVDKLLTALGLEPTNPLNSETDVDNYVEAVKKYLLPLMPRDFWFGKPAFIDTKEIRKELDRFGDKFYDMYKLDIKVAKPIIKKALKDNKLLKKAIRDLNIKTWGTEFTPGTRSSAKNYKVYQEYYKPKMQALRNLPDSNFGKEIKETNPDTGKEEVIVSSFSRTGYKDVFEKGRSGKDLDSAVKSFNKKTKAVHRALWDRINIAIRTDKKAASTIGNYLKLTAKQSNHWHKLGATITAYSPKPKGVYKIINGKKTLIKYEYEHAMPATAAYLYLLGTAVENNPSFSASYDLLMSNYKLIALDANENQKLNKAGFGRGMVKGWNPITDSWWQRYFNETVALFDGGIDPASIKTIDGRTLADVLGIKADGTLKNITQSKAQLKRGVNILKANKNLNDFVQTKFSKDVSRGMSTFDFDETVGVSENFIIAKKDGVTKKIASDQWPFVGDEMIADGWTMDFSDFDKVTKGKPGPLFEKMKNQIAKYGPDNVFILTARGPGSQVAIHEWLKANGINIPLKNVTGLGQSSGQAKADWMLDKFAEGYNDMYFVDDALPNVEAVKNVLEQLDIKSKVVQAKVKFSQNINIEFNDMIERRSKIDSKRIISRSEAEIMGRKSRWDFFVPPAAEDFRGLLRKIVGKGKQGDADLDWFKKVLFDPFGKAYMQWNEYKQSMTDDYYNLKKQNPKIVKALNKIIPGTVFTNDTAIRVYLWNKAGYNTPGMTTEMQDRLIKEVNSNKEMKAFADSLGVISRVKEGYVKPSEYWTAETIASDLANAVNKIGRTQFLQEWIQNKNIVFSKDNLNKLEAAFGTDYIDALKDILHRMETGSNRATGKNKQVNALVDWVNGSVGTIMFLNIRSASLQTISMVNFLNYENNNIFAAAKAFANQKQFWTDFMFLMNSPMLKQRRAGLAIDVSASELTKAYAEGKGKPQAIIAFLLEKGFAPTKIADSFAIAMGGSTFYRNQLKFYLKQGMSEARAKEQAFLDFQEIAEETQQSSRPDFISQQQAGPLGRFVLAFQNTPAQMTRLTKKGTQDLANGRGDAKSNVSKILYYGLVQNLIFGALQNAMFALAWGDEEDREERYKSKEIRIANGALDTLLRGSGLYGAIFAAIKNTYMQWRVQRKKPYGKREDFRIYQEMLSFSPPLGSKFRKIMKANKTEQYNKGVGKKLGFRIENPNFHMIANLIEAGTNAPIARALRKANNIEEAVTGNHALLQRVFLGMGWDMWSLGIKDEELTKAKDEVKQDRANKNKKNNKKKKKTLNNIYDNKFINGGDMDGDGKREYRCIGRTKSGKQCGNRGEYGKAKKCYAHK